MILWNPKLCYLWFWFFSYSTLIHLHFYSYTKCQTRHNDSFIWLMGYNICIIRHPIAYSISYLIFDQWCNKINYTIISSRMKYDKWCDILSSIWDKKILNWDSRYNIQGIILQKWYIFISYLISHMLLKGIC